jgi:hypothetical protein
MPLSEVVPTSPYAPGSGRVEFANQQSSMENQIEKDNFAEIIFLAKLARRWTQN